MNRFSRTGKAVAVEMLCSQVGSAAARVIAANSSDRADKGGHQEVRDNGVEGNW